MHPRLYGPALNPTEVAQSFPIMLAAVDWWCMVTCGDCLDFNRLWPMIGPSAGWSSDFGMVVEGFPSGEGRLGKQRPMPESLTFSRTKGRVDDESRGPVGC